MCSSCSGSRGCGFGPRERHISVDISSTDIIIADISSADISGAGTCHRRRQR